MKLADICKNISDQLHDHPGFDPGDDPITPETVLAFIMELKVAGIDKPEVVKAFKNYLTRDDLWGPFHFIRDHGFTVDGKCDIRRGKPKKKEQRAWHFDRPVVAPKEFRETYKQEHGPIIVSATYTYYM